MKLSISNSFTEKVPADANLQNISRQVKNACFSYVTPQTPAQPKLLHTSKEMLQALGFSEKESTSKDFLNIFTGATVLKGTKPYAMCYGGHQFGNWAGQLGDGRAINLFEVLHKNKRWAVQLKGAGKTPYSRTADGLAVLRSSIREYLCSEAMHYLGVPTTRALTLSLSGNAVLRDVLYNGNPAYEKGAIVSRVAPSFIRFGNFEILSARENVTVLKQLADYTIKYFYTTIKENGTQKYLAFFREVSNKTIDLILNWQRVGFVHGVMNTDNMSILGLTIDYGPYGWLEGYDVNWTPNTTDVNKRYSYKNQASIGLWNLVQLANALYPLIKETTPLQAILDEYATIYIEKYYKMMASKLGLFTINKKDKQLIEELEKTLQLTETDMTIFFRNLANISIKETKEAAFNNIQPAFYELDTITDAVKNSWHNWLNSYLHRLKKETLPEIKKKQQMDLINPKYVLRNYMAQLAIDAANKEDYSLINTLHQLLKNPYLEQPKHQKWFAKRPEWARHKIGCSMLSCSS